MLIPSIITNAEDYRILIDQGSSANILLYEAFWKMQLQDRHLHPFNIELVSFTGDRQQPKGCIEA